MFTRTYMKFSLNKNNQDTCQLYIHPQTFFPAQSKPFSLSSWTINPHLRLSYGRIRLIWSPPLNGFNNRPSILGRISITLGFVLWKGLHQFHHSRHLRLWFQKSQFYSWKVWTQSSVTPQSKWVYDLVIIYNWLL